MSGLYTILLLGIRSLFTSGSNVAIRTCRVKTKVQVSLITCRQRLCQCSDQNGCEEEAVLTHVPMLIDICDGFKCENITEVINMHSFQAEGRQVHGISEVSSHLAVKKYMNKFVDPGLELRK